MHGMKKEVRFGERAAAYDSGYEGRFSRKFYALLLAHLTLRPGMHLLDAGCGTGALLQRIASRCKVNGYGIDTEEKMIAETRTKCADMNIQFCRSEQTPFANGTFDAITACLAYHHFSDQAGFAKEAARILKKGGNLYIADLRLPGFIRKPLNAIVSHMGIAGRFPSLGEIYADFAPYGFQPVGTWVDGHAQLVVLKRT